MENEYILIVRLNQVGQRKVGDPSTACMPVKLVHNAYICGCLCALVLHIKQGFRYHKTVLFIYYRSWGS